MTIPGLDEIAGTSYRQTWKVRRYLTFLSRRDMRDLLTGERLEVERHFGSKLEVHHLFATNWFARGGFPPTDADTLPNLTWTSRYANGSFIRDHGPRAYVNELLDDRGVSRVALKRLLDGHLIDLEIFESQDFAVFVESRAKRWAGFLQQELGSHV